MDLEATRADHNIYNVQVLRNGATVNMNGGKAWFTVKVEEDDTLGVINLNSDDNPNQVVFIDDVHGKMQIVLNPSDTDFVTRDTAFHYDLQTRESDGRISTAAEGVLRIRMDVTT